MPPELLAALGAAFRYGSVIFVAKGWMPAEIADALPEQLTALIAAAYPFGVMAYGVWRAHQLKKAALAAPVS